jgi:hypothetical protein
MTRMREYTFSKRGEGNGRGNENEIVPSPLPGPQAGSIYANI